MNERGLDLSKLSAGIELTVWTENNIYSILVLKDEKYLVQGGKYFKEPTETKIYGSVMYLGSPLKAKWLMIGMQMETDHCTTSRIRSIRIEDSSKDWYYDL